MSMTALEPPSCVRGWWLRRDDLFRSGTPLACRIGLDGLHCPWDSLLTSADIVVSSAEGPDRALVGLQACVPLGVLSPDQLKQIRGLDTVLSGDQTP